jgi:hypothetical protein
VKKAQMKNASIKKEQKYNNPSKSSTKGRRRSLKMTPGDLKLSQNSNEKEKKSVPPPPSPLAAKKVLQKKVSTRRMSLKKAGPPGPPGHQDHQDHQDQLKFL